jgi:hypothetical protein
MKEEAGTMANTGMHAERPTLFGAASLSCLASFSLIRLFPKWSGRRVVAVAKENGLAPTRPFWP